MILILYYNKKYLVSEIISQIKKSGKKFVIGDTGAGYAGKMLSMAAKKFGLKCKIFMGAKDIKRQQPNVKAMKRNGAEVVPVYSGSQTLVDAVSECMRYWVANCDSAHMAVGSTVGPAIFVRICGWSTSLNFQRTQSNK